ncbi:hypothetical protein [Wukongibacter sp. M2B1]|uniref:hypothetical protein n=1 Tax=Wukongibacter sp. M2B1 TaxID=3088895 RepID=UPI003D7C066D
MKSLFKINLQLHSSGIPTSKDIYFRIINDDGESQKVAVVESYRASKKREVRSQKEFGSDEPVATYATSTDYELEITRAYATKEAINDGIYLDDLENFDFVIEKPDRTETYSGCNWGEIGEDGKLEDKVTENMRFTAAKFKRNKK